MKQFGSCCKTSWPSSRGQAWSFLPKVTGLKNWACVKRETVETIPCLERAWALESGCVKMSASDRVGLFSMCGSSLSLLPGSRPVCRLCVHHGWYIGVGALIAWCFTANSACSRCCPSLAISGTLVLQTFLCRSLRASPLHVSAMPLVLAEFLLGMFLESWGSAVQT